VIGSLQRHEVLLCGIPPQKIEETPEYGSFRTVSRSGVTFRHAYDHITTFLIICKEPSGFYHSGHFVVQYKKSAELSLGGFPLAILDQAFIREALMIMVIPPIVIAMAHTHHTTKAIMPASMISRPYCQKSPVNME
jgi:hypothetical protein